MSSTSTFSKVGESGELAQASAVVAHHQALLAESDIKDRNLATPFLLERPAPPISILSWLAVQPQWPHFFWCNRDRSFEIGGSGLCLPLEVNQGEPLESLHDGVHQVLDSHPQKDSLYFLGGSSFFNNGSNDPGWENFPRSGFFLPQTFLLRKDGQLRFGVIGLVQIDDTPTTLLERTKRIANESTLTAPALPNWRQVNLCTRADVPDLGEWSLLVDLAVQEIRSTRMKKVVLARRSDFELSHEINPYALLQALRGAFGNCYSIMYAPLPSKFLLGISPECLLKIKDGQISSDVLAGTVARGRNDREDKMLSKRLTESHKMRREYDFVLEDVRSRLAHFGNLSDNTDGPRLLKLSTVQHLSSEVTARLYKDASLFDILRSLHPTPAVGGFPREDGLRFIQKYEPFTRGWYGAPIGVLAHEQAEFAVSIRSALLEGSQLSLYTGCGIVEGSEAQAEWEELESKMDTILDFFGELSPEHKADLASGM